MSNHRFQVSFIALLVIIGLSLYLYTTKPRSYSWDITFDNAQFDTLHEMYVKRRYAELDGIYNISFWCEASNEDLIRVQFFTRNERDLRAEWRIKKGTITYGQDVYGEKYEKSWSGHSASIWKIYSSSREPVVYIRIKYLESDPDWPPHSG